MIRNPLYKSLLFIIPFLAGCSTYKKTYVSPNETIQLTERLPSDQAIETLYLIGDAGDPDILKGHSNYLFEHLNKELSAATRKSSIVFLGDNIYPAGLPQKKDGDRAKSEALLDEQLEMVNGYTGETYFIPGNHDWNHWKAGGLKAIQRQEKYIQDYFPKKEQDIKFYPNDGCGDPEVVKVSKDLYYIFIDSQWWLQDWNDESKINKGCAIKSRQEFLQSLEELFLIHKNDQLVVFMHHPLFSNGEHGGKFSLKTHIFPLTDIKKNAWIPLPVLGSIIPINRSLGSSRQDIANPLYQQLKNEILGMLKLNKNIIFAAGHEHSLQYFHEQNQHFVVSGTGSKVSHSQKGGKAKMVRASIGYSKINFYANGESWLDFIIVNEDSPDGELIFRKKIINAKAGSEEMSISYLPGEMLPDSVVVAANIGFKAKKFKSFLMGNQYRSTWASPVKVPVINFDTEKGGIVPIKKGGGMASNSLRVENSEGDQYALRSINKDLTKVLGPELGSLKAMNILQDMNSASHPYAPLALPTLSRAANIYYTKPKLVFLKKQEGLGNYNELFKEELYLLEDRPEGDRRDFDNLANSKEIISYLDLIELQLEDNRIDIDEEWTLRSRLFDIWIHDWDRHDDQWRWAKIKEDGEEFYRPIPRDRDQTFYKFQGVLPWITSHFVIRKFKTFKDNVKDVKYQSFNAKYFDRYFLHELDWEEWKKEIEYLQANLTDEVIAEAMTNLPPEINELSAAEIESKLKSRRDNLSSIAEKLYKYISKDVSIPGSNENELFEVKRHEDGSVKVKVFSLTKKGKKKDKLYSRSFNINETDEIRLYGLGGQDEFSISGKTKKSILLRVIGGFGNDKLKDNSFVSGLTKKTKVYDEKNGIKIKAGKEVRDLTGPNIEENDYEREDHLYNKHAIMPSLGYSFDDNFWLGAGLTSTLHGFRKTPYKAKHNLSFTYSPSSRDAFHLKYESDLNSVLFNYLDVNVGLQLDNPFYINYFGLGNETVQGNQDSKYNWVRLTQYQGHFFIQKKWLKERFSLYAGPKYTSWRVNNVSGRVLDNTNLTPAPDVFEFHHYLGGVLGFTTDSRDSKMFPKSGIMSKIEGSMHRNIGTSETINFLKVEQSFYLTFGTKFATTLASRTGWSRAGGDLNFYNFPSLGNNTYLRGFRNDRFRGNHIFYQNLDIRLKLVQWKNKILPMGIGLVGGYDVGRVWLDNENSGQFHHGYTAGVWFNVLNFLVIQPHFSMSKEQKLYNFRIGFNF
ncbi:MAG: hypothetical protein ACI8V8_000838 [Chitinophagales bacterium]|jgi:hypothetical protein